MENTNIPVVVNIVFRRYVLLILSVALRDGLCKHGFSIVNATIYNSASLSVKIVSASCLDNNFFIDHLSLASHKTDLCKE